MFKELAPYLRQRAVLLTVTHLEHDQIRVNVVPKKLKDAETRPSPPRSASPAPPRSWIRSCQIR
jgi:hypothetical protein